MCILYVIDCIVMSELICESVFKNPLRYALCCLDIFFFYCLPHLLFYCEHGVVNPTLIVEYLDGKDWVTSRADAELPLAKIQNDVRIVFDR